MYAIMAFGAMGLRGGDAVMLLSRRYISLSVVFFFALLIFTSFAYSLPRVAVMDFESIGVDEYLGVAAAELVRTQLIKTGSCSVVERGLLKKVMAEQRIALSGAVDEATAVKVGKLVGANLVVIGSVSRLGEKIILNSRVVDVQTGVAKAGETFTGESEDDLETMCMKLVERVSEVLSSLTYPSSHAMHPPSPPRKRETPSLLSSHSSRAERNPAISYALSLGIRKDIAKLLKSFGEDGRLDRYERLFIKWLSYNDPSIQPKYALRYSLEGRITTKDLRKLPDAVLLRESFSDNRNGWDIGRFESATISIENGRLYFYIEGSWEYWTTIELPKLKRFKKYIVEVTVSRKEGSQVYGYYGIVFKGKDADNCYIFWEGDDSYWAVERFINSKSKLIVKWQKGPQILGALRVVVDGNRYKFYLLSGDEVRYVGEVEDSEIKNGGIIGVAASGPAKIRFDDFRVIIPRDEILR
ncbi:MAG: hypothetical protein J7M13_07855 [Synergistetes bacterium]|nr:hypothetical protein [Synergistota bacterium]